MKAPVPIVSTMLIVVVAGAGAGAGGAGVPGSGGAGAGVAGGAGASSNERMAPRAGVTVLGDAGDMPSQLQVVRALATARDSEFDAAILDVSLAGHSSLPVAKLLDERGKPYLYATGYGSAPEGSSAGTLPVLRKPFQLSELEEAMKRLTEV